MQKLIDTHAHLYLPEFESDRAAMLDRSKKEGIEQIYLPAIDSATHDAMIQLENSFRNARP